MNEYDVLAQQFDNLWAAIDTAKAPENIRKFKLAMLEFVLDNADTLMKALEIAADTTILSDTTPASKFKAGDKVRDTAADIVGQVKTAYNNEYTVEFANQTLWYDAFNRNRLELVTGDTTHGTNI